ncbi:hypothetical protein [Streptomyces tagetis]|uniref:Uncharacterized protein n=1 Tax=Streptomyces tagetis TaxID=2820809 RepID=A0A941B394_9ACTN|nr:hypothetical protein [Streptomyces sp. RG38]MBQ0830051.1 hypothetical protein [Streptomyces sp. RG38]
MSHDDQGGRGRPPGPGAAGAAVPRRRRRTRVVLAVTAGGVLAAAVAVDAPPPSGPGGDPPPAASRTTAGTSTPSVALPGTADGRPPLPAVRPERAFPATAVRLPDGSRYKRLDLVTTADCSHPMGPGALAGRDEGCRRLTAALFTDAERRSRVTVTVVSFRRAEDASALCAALTGSAAGRRAVPLDPPPGSGLPPAPPGAPAVRRHLPAARSVVLADGRWADGGTAGAEALTRQTEGLARYARDNVVAYEGGGAGPVRECSAPE